MICIGVSRKFSKKLSPSQPSTALHLTAHRPSPAFISASNAYAIAPASIFVNVAPSYPTPVSDTYRSDGRYRQCQISSFFVLCIEPSIQRPSFPASVFAGARYFPYDPGLIIFPAFEPRHHFSPVGSPACLGLIFSARSPGLCPYPSYAARRALQGGVLLRLSLLSLGLP